jgi:hypothetical protein
MGENFSTGKGSLNITGVRRNVIFFEAFSSASRVLFNHSRSEKPAGWVPEGLLNKRSIFALHDACAGAGMMLSMGCSRSRES